MEVVISGIFFAHKSFDRNQSRLAVFGSNEHHERDLPLMLLNGGRESIPASENEAGLGPPKGVWL